MEITAKRLFVQTKQQRARQPLIAMENSFIPTSIHPTVAVAAMTAEKEITAKQVFVQTNQRRARQPLIVMENSSIRTTIHLTAAHAISSAELINIA